MNLLLACLAFALLTESSTEAFKVPTANSVRLTSAAASSATSTDPSTSSTATTERKADPFTTQIAPGRRRRRIFGEPPKLRLPLSFISAVVAALKTESIVDAVPVFVRVLQQDHEQNEALPVSYKSFESLEFVKDCVQVQAQVRQASAAVPFLKELTPASCQLDRNDRNGQLEWLKEHANELNEYKLSHGAVLFRSWALFEDSRGVSQAYQALNLTPCRDPKEVRGPAPLLSDSSTIYETLNNMDDAATYLGLHYEGIPGIMPSNALFSCFQAAKTGGEFLLCDGRRVFRDLNTTTLMNLETKQLRPTFADIPDWMASPPWPLSAIPYAVEMHRELLSLVTDMTKPTDDFFLDLFPAISSSSSSSTSECLKLTTHPATPVLHHPVSKEPVWFSGIDSGHRGLFIQRNPQLHTSNGKYASEVFDVRYGDGTVVSEDDLSNILTACEKNTRDLRMQPGDAVF